MEENEDKKTVISEVPAEQENEPVAENVTDEETIAEPKPIEVDVKKSESKQKVLKSEWEEVVVSMNDKDDAKSLVVLFVVAAVLVLGCIGMFLSTVSTGAAAMAESYQKNYEAEKAKTYQEWYQAAFDQAEEKYHVSNRAVISIGNLSEAERLEVLKANTVEFVTEDRSSASGNVTAWLEVTGEGTFVVELKAAEFLVDNERSYVLVRLPYPELTNVTITDTTKRFFQDDMWNGNYSQGVKLAEKQREEALLQMQKAMLSNQYIYESAQSIAKSIIKNLVFQFNPDIPELSFEFEFMD